MKLLTSIEAYARRFPRRPALVFGEDRRDYGTLVRQARRLAAFLGAAPHLSNRKEPVAAVLGGRESLTPLCFLACAMAGAAYLPLDPACPPARRRQILADSGAALLLGKLGQK